MGTVWTVLGIEMAVVLVAAVVATRWVYRRFGPSRRRRLAGARVRAVATAAGRETRDRVHA